MIPNGILHGSDAPLWISARQGYQDTLGLKILPACIARLTQAIGTREQLT